jgi:predicted ATPase/DNA-binding SARP family transcriptional activator
MRIQLLGGFAVEVGGRDVAVRPWRLRKSRTLVKVLALAPEQRMHRDRLLDLLWPDLGASAAANNLHQALHVARRELTGLQHDAPVLLLRDGLVVLHGDGPVETDVRRFRASAAHAWATRTLDDLAVAIDAYTGELLPEDRFEDWTSGARDDLRQGFCDLLVAHAVECVRLGRVGGAFGSLRRALEADPLHEPATREQMRLLADQGRRSEALALYEQLRTGLTEAYGTDPDPESRRLFRDLLAGSVDTAAPPQPLSGRSNLQPALTSFIGRVRQLADVHRELSRTRLVTLTGPGGVGKTRLAEEAVRGLVDDYRDGVWAVDLVPVTTSERLPDAVTEAMGLDPAAGADPMRTLVARLSTRRLLLLLDNCEHLVGACADLVRRLLRECPELRVLTTSREPLHVPGEVTLRVPSLAVPLPTDPADAALTHEAVRLLVDRARDVRSDFRLDEVNVAHVVEICRRLDGVPLAIELAAARLAHLEPAEIAERLSNALTMLGSADRMTRHATLQATVEWSHGLLTDDEQVLLRRLSAFAGSFTLRAVEGVCATSPLAPSVLLDCLGRLVDKSMVQVERTAERSRYRLLETIRQFGWARLIEAGEGPALQTAHCRYFLQVALDHDPDRHSGVVVVGTQSLDHEHDNLRAALAWSLGNDPDGALLLAVRMWRYWLARGHFVEGSRWLEQALAAASPSLHVERSRALLAIAVLDARQGRSSRFSELGAAAVTEMAAVGPPVDVALTRVLVGFPQPIVGNVGLAAEIAAQGLAEAEALGSSSVAAAAYWLQSQIGLQREDIRAALSCLRRTLAAVDQVEPGAPAFLPVVTTGMELIPCAGQWVPAFEETALIGRQVGRPQAPGYIWSALGSAHQLRRDLPSAADAVRRSTEVFDDLGDDAGLAHALHHLGCVERDLGQIGDARAHLQEALGLRRRLGDRRGENVTLANLGLTDAAGGDFDAGRRLTRVALAQGEEVEDGPGVAGSLLAIAVVELFAGDLALSRVLAEQAAEAFRPQGYRRLTAWTLQFAAELAVADGHYQTGRRSAAEAAALFAEAGCLLGRARAAALAAEMAAKSR